MSESPLWLPPGYDYERTIRARAELQKSVAGQNPTPQPYRLSPMPMEMGPYSGIKESQWRGRVSYRMLREVPRRNPVIAAILRKRQNQVAAFSRRPNFDGDTGFRVRMRDPNANPSPGDKKRIYQIEDLILRGGYIRKSPYNNQPAVWDSEWSETALGFQQAMRALCWDSLTLDAAAFRMEVGANVNKYPVVYYTPVDAALVRFAVPKQKGNHAVNMDNDGGRPEQRYTAGTVQQGSAGGKSVLIPYDPQIRKNLPVAYVMLDPEGVSVTREFAWNELQFLVRNPRTDYYMNGYGFSEIEMMLEIITGILYGIKFNVEYFDSAHLPPGFFSLQGSYSDEVILDFRRQLRMMVGGPGQFWAAPVIASEEPGGEAKYVPVRNNDNVGMFWREWLLFCANVACALYQMDSSEINFVNYGTSSNSLGQQAPESKVKYAQESGLEPLLAAFQRMFDEAIVERYDPDFCFEWTGISRADSAQEMAESQHRMAFGLSTPNMELARLDEDPIRDPTDRELWNECLRAAAERLGIDPDAIDEVDEPRLDKLAIRSYEAAGGEFAQWADAPVGNPAALGVWQLEHQLDQQSAQMAAQAQGLGQGGMMGPDGSTDTEDPDATGPQQGMPGAGGGPENDQSQPMYGSPPANDDRTSNVFNKSLVEVIFRRPRKTGR